MFKRLLHQFRKRKLEKVQQKLQDVQLEISSLREDHTVLNAVLQLKTVKLLCQQDMACLSTIVMISWALTFNREQIEKLGANQTALESKEKRLQQQLGLVPA